ncbi:MAG TPA: hypothetical protein VM491_23190 [Burkholderiaceae bacterium]|nr:hypothetical protein [Burkholderiaceae bacterium]
MPITRKLLAAAVAAAFVPAAALAENSADRKEGARAEQPAAERQQAMVTPPVAVQRTLTIRGEVKSIDKDQRMVRIDGPGDSDLQVRVREDAEGFDRISEGDRVVVTYTEAMATSLVRGGQAEKSGDQKSSDQAQKSDDKAGAQDRAAGHRTIVAEVTGINRDEGQATLRTRDDEEISLRIGDQAALQNLQKGDRVVASYVHAAAMRIVPDSPTAADRSATDRQSMPTAGAQPAAGSQQPAAGAGISAQHGASPASGAPAHAGGPAQARSDGSSTTVAGQPQAGQADVRTAQPQYSEPMQKLLNAAQELREAIQALAQKPAGPERQQAIERARDALHTTQQAMLQVPELRDATARDATPGAATQPVAGQQPGAQQREGAAMPAAGAPAQQQPGQQSGQQRAQ